MKIQIIVGSVREGRIAIKVANWIHQAAYSCINLPPIPIRSLPLIPVPSRPLRVYSVIELQEE